MLLALVLLLALLRPADWRQPRERRGLRPPHGLTRAAGCQAQRVFTARGQYGLHSFTETEAGPGGKGLR